MGEIYLDKNNRLLIIRAVLIFYGNAADTELSKVVAADVESHWNEPNATVKIKNDLYNVRFSITGTYDADLTETSVYENTDPAKNYFRVETFVHGNISFVDGINSNTGYFKLDNLLNNSSTAAHEFGHTIGLEHPGQLDIRGHGTPGIMYPRGTIVDPPFQYDPHAAPLQPGGTMNPFTRKVLPGDIANLRLSSLAFNAGNTAILGNFSSVWHHPH